MTGFTALVCTHGWKSPLITLTLFAVALILLYRFFVSYFFIPMQKSEPGAMFWFPTVTMAYDSNICERPTTYAYLYTSIHHHMVDFFPFTVGIEFASSWVCKSVFKLDLTPFAIGFSLWVGLLHMLAIRSANFRLERGSTIADGNLLFYALRLLLSQW